MIDILSKLLLLKLNLILILPVTNLAIQNGIICLCLLECYYNIIPTNKAIPDITFAVSQVCHFTSNSKKSYIHGVGIVVDYLKGAANKGSYCETE